MAVIGNKIVKNIGLDDTQILESTAFARYTLLGLSLTNVTNLMVNVDVVIDNGYYIKDVVLPSRTSLRVVSTGEKLILGYNTRLSVKSSLPDSVDVVASYAAIVDQSLPTDVELNEGYGISFIRDSANDITVSVKLEDIYLKIAADDSNIISVPLTDSIKISGERNIATYSDADGNIRIQGPDLTPYQLTSTAFNGQFNNLLNKPTTLAGYGITDAATSTQGSLADSALQPADNITQLTNNANFTTKTYVDTAIGNATFDKEFSSLLNIPTTIAGYGITDAFSGNVSDLFQVTNNPSTGQVLYAASSNSFYWGASSALTLATLQDVTATSNANDVLTSAGNGTFYFKSFQAGLLSALEDVDTDSSVLPGLVLTADGNGLYSFQETLGDNQKFFTAEVTVNKGDVVVVNSNGNVEPVTEFVGGDTLNPATNTLPIVFTDIGEEASIIDVAYSADNNKVAVIWKNQDGYGFVRVGEITGNTIEFGPSYKFLNDEIAHTAITFIPNNQLIFAYTDVNNSNKGFAVAADVITSNNTLSIGSAVETSNGFQGLYHSISYDSLANVTVLAFKGESDRGQVRLLTTTGTTVNLVYIDPFSVNPAETMNYIDSITNVPGDGTVSNDFTLLAYQDGATGRGYANLIWTNALGTSFQVGPHYVFSTNNPITDISVVWDSFTDFCVVCYSDGGNSGRGTAVTGYLTGSYINFGTPVVFDTGSTSKISASFDSENQKVIISYERNTTDPAKIGITKVGIVRAATNTIEFEPDFIFADGQGFPLTAVASVFDSTTNKTVIAYGDKVDNNQGEITLFSAESNLYGNANRFIGVADDDIPAGQSGKINLRGAVDRHQTSLTFDQIYYLNSDASFTTTKTDFGLIGKGLNTDHLQIFPETSWEKIYNTPTTFAGYGIEDADAQFEFHEFIRGGTTVALRDDGKIEKVFATYTENLSTTYTDHTFTLNDINDIDSAFNGKDKIIVVYKDITDSDTKVVVGQIKADNTIDYGTPKQVASAIFDVAVTYHVGLDFVVILYNNEVRLAEIAGTEINLRSPINLPNTAIAGSVSAIYNTNDESILLHYEDTNDSNQGKIVVGSITNGTLSLGTEQTFDTNVINNIKAVHDPNTNQSIISYHRSNGNVMLVSASFTTVTTITVNIGDAVVAAVDGDYNDIVTTPENDRLVIIYRDVDNNNYGTYRTGAIVGTGFDLKLPYTFAEYNVIYLAAAYESNSTRVSIAFRDTTNGRGKIQTGVINPAGTFLFLDPEDIYFNPSWYNDIVTDTVKNKIIISYRGNTTGPGQSTLYDTAYTTVASNAGKFIGIVKASTPAGQIGPVYTNGKIADQQASLLTNQDYYLSEDGSLTLTQTEYGIIGKSLSAESILLSSDSITQLYIDNAIAGVTFSFNYTGTDNISREIGSGNTLKIIGNDNTYTESASDGSLTIFSGTHVDILDTNNTPTKSANDFVRLQFDADSGFDFVDLGNKEVKISLTHSTFRTWQAESQEDLIAEGYDTLTWIAGAGIGITFNANNKTVEFSNTAVGDGSGVWKITGDDSTVRAVAGGQTIQFIGGDNINTESSITGDVTINLDTYVSTTKLQAQQLTRESEDGYGLYFGTDTAKTIVGRSTTAVDNIFLECQTGNILATGDITTEYTSDERLKTITGSLENVLDTIANIDTIKFKWNDLAQQKFLYKDDKEEIGVKAQQIQEYYPELVVERGDTGFLKVDYQKFTVVLLEAVKELSKKLNELEKRLEK